MADELMPLTPAEGIERFLEHREPSVRESTLQNARTRLRHFLDWCEEEEIENLNELSGRYMSEVGRWRQGQVAPITVQKQLSTVRMFLRWCEDIEAVSEGLSEKVHAPELPDGAAARSVQLPTERAEEILECLDRYEYATRAHVITVLLWRTGMRRGALHGIDLDDLHPEENAVKLKHRPETDTPLKNGKNGERWVYLGPVWFEVVEEYIDQHRWDQTDDHGREPLITTRYGRASATTIYDTIHRVTQPCRFGECPHDIEVQDCEAIGEASTPSKCPSSRSPHAIRRGSITHFLNKETPPEIVSERADVSLDVLYQHYDARTQREKMTIRKDRIPDS